MLLAAALAAHDLPQDLTVQAFIRPSGDRLQVLTRVPLRAMRDIVFPQREQGSLDFSKADFLLEDAAQLWIAGALDVYENDVLLPKPRVVGVRTSLESDRSFATINRALARIAGEKLTNAVNVPWGQLLLDVQFEYPIQSPLSRFSVHPKFARLGQQVLTVLRFVPSPDTVRPFEFTGDPGLVFLDPSWTQAAWRFVKLGFVHILSGTDHLLFLLCLVIPFRRFFALVPVVTAFTVAHSMTLIASAYNLGPDALWFAPLIETLIAVSIVYMAIENIFKPDGTQQRWIMAFAFGLIHGFGFSFILRETLQFAGSHLLSSLLAFNIGVELGQLLVLLLAIPLLNWLFRQGSERLVAIVLSTLVAHTGWHWMTERYDKLVQFRFEWPLFDAAFWAVSLRFMAIAVLLAGLVLWMQRKHRRA